MSGIGRFRRALDGQCTARAASQLDQKGRANVSLGAIVFTSAEFDHGAIGVFYGVGTFGETERALTVGAGGAS